MNLPLESLFLVYGSEGVAAVAHDGDLIQLTTDPVAAAFAVGDSMVISQRTADPAVGPAVGEGPIVVHTPSANTEFQGEPEERIRLFDVAIVHGRPVAVITAETGDNPEDTEERLVLLDLETLERTDLAVVGRWERSVAQVRVAEGVIVTLTNAGVDHHLQAHTADGELLWAVDNVAEPDTSVTLVATGREVLLLAPQSDEDFVPGLAVKRYDPATGALVESRTTVLKASFGGGFCQAADWNGDLLVCSESYGGPFSVDLETGLVATLTTLSEGTPSYSRVIAPTATASQSPEDAQRDGIVPTIAALPLELRVTPWPDDFGPTRIEASEGVWLVSTPAAEIPGLRNECLIGNTEGDYGRDYVCTFEYAEILLLDRDSGEILRAYPFAPLNPDSLLLTDEALYCVSQGDGARPDSMLCRIDRSTLEAVVRAFPSANDSVFGPGSGLHVPENWVIDQPVDFVLWENIAYNEGRIVISGWSGIALVDPITLELLNVALG